MVKAADGADGVPMRVEERPVGKKKAGIPRPVVQALLLADHVYADALTQKKIIAGTFNQLASPAFPAQFPQPVWAYVALTGVRGRHAVVLRYSDFDSDEALIESAPIPLEGDDPRRLNELVIQVPRLPMPHPGTYTMELLVDGEMLGSLRVLVEQQQGGDTPPSNEENE
jgi:hypothetical protein